MAVREKALGIALLVAALVPLGIGLSSWNALPEEPAMPEATGPGDEFERRSQEWIDAVGRRSDAQTAAMAWLFGGLALAGAGLRLLSQARRASAFER